MNIRHSDSHERPPLVSVILVTMNRREMLRSCLISLEKQEFVEAEIIVIDNGSTDGTGEMVRSFPGVRYSFSDVNLGVPGGRNLGVQMSCGEYCIFLDDDAFFKEQDALSRVVAYFRSDDRLGCVAFRIVKSADGIEEYKSIPRLDKKILNEDYECSYFCGAGFACRRNLFQEIGMLWGPLFFIAEEMDFSYRLVNKGYKILRSAAITVIHNETPQARVKGKWIYYGVRSRCWVAARNLPLLNAVFYILLWWGYFFMQGMRYGYVIFFILGVKDAVIGLRSALQNRSCITKQTIKKLKILSGRVYY